VSTSRKKPSQSDVYDEIVHVYSEKPTFNPPPGHPGKKRERQTRGHKLVCTRAHGHEQHWKKCYYAFDFMDLGKFYSGGGRRRRFPLPHSTCQINLINAPISQQHEKKRKKHIMN
jgi:hypothetical protein